MVILFLLVLLLLKSEIQVLSELMVISYFLYQEVFTEMFSLPNLTVQRARSLSQCDYVNIYVNVLLVFKHLVLDVIETLFPFKKHFVILCWHWIVKIQFRVTMPVASAVYTVVCVYSH